jgi:hypothetical protein
MNDRAHTAVDELEVVADLDRRREVDMEEER